VLFQGRLPVKKYDKYALDADEDEGVPLPPAPKDGNVSGKPRSFLQYAPSWAKHPDYDRVWVHARTFFLLILASSNLGFSPGSSRKSQIKILVTLTCAPANSC